MYLVSEATCTRTSAHNETYAPDIKNMLNKLLDQKCEDGLTTNATHNSTNTQLIGNITIIISEMMLMGVNVLYLVKII